MAPSLSSSCSRNLRLSESAASWTFPRECLPDVPHSTQPRFSSWSPPSFVNDLSPWNSEVSGSLLSPAFPILSSRPGLGLGVGSHTSLLLTTPPAAPSCLSEWPVAPKLVPAQIPAVSNGFPSHGIKLVTLGNLQDWSPACLPERHVSLPQILHPNKLKFHIVLHLLHASPINMLFLYPLCIGALVSSI